jgi:hypothetical protein
MIASGPFRIEQMWLQVAALTRKAKCQNANRRTGDRKPQGAACETGCDGVRDVMDSIP